MTIHDIARGLHKRLGIRIPHPKVETTHIAADLGVSLPCSAAACPFAYECVLCDQLMQLTRVTDLALLPEYLASGHGIIRHVARKKLNKLRP